MSKKKGLAVIYGSHNLYQFIWYYSTYGRNIEWYALCLPEREMVSLKELCEKSGIFKEIIYKQEYFGFLPMGKKIIIFLKMFFSFFVGKKNRYCKKFISQYITDLDFDIAVVLSDYGLISGMLISLGKEKDIVILEDGIGDYLVRKYSNIFKFSFNLWDFQGFILSLLGYSNTGCHFPLRTTKDCVKFCSHPEKLSYKKYKKIKPLLFFDDANKKIFSNILSKIYPKLDNFFITDATTILMTVPLTDYSDTPEDYYKRAENFFNNIDCKSLIIKKHPRDMHKYCFSNKIKIIEIDQTIPAEVLLHHFINKKVYFMYFSSTLLYAQNFNFDALFFYFKGLKGEKKTKGRDSKYPSKESFVERLSFWNYGKCNLIEI